MHIHILGIGGTFMAGIARLAVEMGHRVTGADAHLYPPMSDQLDELGVAVYNGYDAAALDPAPDMVIIGNALSRGNPSVEYVLSNRLRYTSGPAWLYEEVLRHRHVIAVAGTHGKTTVTSIVTWMLEHGGMEPGFLVGGVMENFGVSARLGHGKFFVVEADEYDTAFFDKRSKFVHYAPGTLIVNNLEFDHADIFADLDAIKRQFHHLIRTLPREALIVCPTPDEAIDALLEMGAWSRVTRFGEGADAAWRYDYDGASGMLSVTTPAGEHVQGVSPLLGGHNAHNVAAAMVAVADVGLTPAQALAALHDFANVKRRLELRGCIKGVSVFDDFAHHPTAIAATIAALRPRVTAPGRLIAVSEMRSNTMRMGVHRDILAGAFAGADRTAILAPPDLPWDINAAFAALPDHHIFTDSAALVTAVSNWAHADDALLVMSNGAFENVHARLLAALEQRP
ncbi:MAG: UDP-N-acetylmuramate:L-alanyl-gamma-D-glutamyl-meso-diaminopimelate ligase [Gammaproteobacteria bacterium]|nr:UDP-N-acetylmuramate:L-alanyl-gamma-D-glutamyl-meso-diaminopimelate ligase [Gammaproteobacteria bacterium]